MANDDAEFEYFKNSLGLYISDPWERVKFIFRKNDYGEPHPELQKAIDAVNLGFTTGLIFGGTYHQRKYLREIKERSDANIYHSRNDAYRQLCRESLKGFINGGFLWGTRIALFSGFFSLFASCVEAYRNKPGVIEYTVAGSLVGAMLRLHYGIRGTLVGSLLGSVLGTIYGIANVGILKLVHGDAIQLKYVQYSLSKQIDLYNATKKLEEQKTKLDFKFSSIEEHINPLNALSDEEEPKKENTDTQIKEKKI